ncbi:MAG: SRPBCC family protein [Chloroflexi bacterium]|nr:SRPBCC family protein [Chloroflexota bacterium]
MARIHTAIYISKPIDEVYAYVTTPVTWPQWQTSSIEVSGSTDSSLWPGQQVLEEFALGGRRGSVVWTATERRAPYYWSIKGRVAGGGGGLISYKLKSDPDGTFLERDLRYWLPNPLLLLLDLLVIHRQIEDNAQEAMRRLKRLMEANSE